MTLYREARLRGALLDLSDHATWRLTGEDRIRYLNGQVTADIRRLRPGDAIPACVTTAKGKLCGVIHVSAGADFLRIDAEAALRESLGGRLERYIIADDVALLDTTGQECLLHLLLPPGAPPPALPPAVETRAASRVGRPGLDILAPSAELPGLLGMLGGDYVVLPGSVAESFRIEAGIPAWGAELTEETLPPEAGLDQSAIDYHKGCYIGQETISRIKSVGHVNRRLTGFLSPQALAPGMTLHPESDPGGKAGEITSAGWSFGLESWAALGYLKRAFADAPLHARAADGAITRVQARDLPLMP